VTSTKTISQSLLTNSISPNKPSLRQTEPNKQKESYLGSGVSTFEQQNMQKLSSLEPLEMFGF
jgi:hypothetical protein